MIPLYGGMREAGTGRGWGRSGPPWRRRIQPVPRAQEAKAQVVVPVGRVVPVAIGAAYVPRFVVPAAAADHPVRAAATSFRPPEVL